MKKNWIKYFIGLASCLALRLVPFRPPNVEPILAAGMPFAKQYGYLSGFLFGAASIVAYDAVTRTVGPWTAVTAISYGLVGLGAAWFLKSRRPGALNFLAYAVAGTIAYDALTGLTVGPLFFHQPFVDALLGQIPFTLLHLAGNTALAVTVSPLLWRWVVMNRALEPASLFRTRTRRAAA